MNSFWKHVQYSPGCWLWTASKVHDGYGMIGPRADGGERRAHRISYELLVGDIPEGLELDHLCRVRHCVNPDHLEPVTTSENAKRRGAAIRADPDRKCRRGLHLFSETRYVRPNGSTLCRACASDYQRARRK